MSIRQTGRASWYRDGYRKGMIPALLVIAFGVFFLLGNLGIHAAFFEQDNWWAWLILLGALGPLSGAVERYRIVGAVDGEVLHALLAAAAIVMVAVMFILQLSWQQWWPVFVIYGGLCMLTRSWRHAADDRGR
jgi:1,4-dihydroxy-2-naphthoate octaprenyltransferase